MDRNGKGRRFHRRALALAGAAIFGGLASPVIAAPEPSTKLVKCGAQSCLLVTGYRDDPTSVVSINGHAVAVEGARRWKAYLPVALVREWCAANARTIDVSLAAPAAEPATVTRVDLPIGLLADATVLAALEINVR